MNVLYLHQYYKTNSSSGGTRSYEFSKHLSENGFRVHVITGTEIDKNFDNNEKLIVHTTKTNYSNNMRKTKRILAFIDYNFKAFFKGLRIKDFDIIFATSTPLTIGLPAVLLSKLMRKKLIFEVRDVWPDIPIELGYIKNKFLISLLKQYELWIYNNSSHIVVLSKGMYQNLIAKGINQNKLSIIENMANLYLYEGNEEVPLDDFSGKFICIHPGTMGHVNGLDFILDVAKYTINVDKDIIYLLIGEGNRKEHIKRRVQEEGLLNVIIRDPMPKKDIAKIIKSSDVGIMCVENKYKILEDNSANKFFDFLAAGLPVLINYCGWQKEVIEEFNCGKSEVAPNKMAELIIKLRNNPEYLKRMGQNARRLAELEYSDIKAKEKILTAINGL